MAARARSSAALAQSSSERYSVLRDPTTAAVIMVLPTGTSTPDRTRCLPMQIREVVAHGDRHGATGALTAAHLRLRHQTDLRRVTPEFSVAEEIPNGVNVERLVAEFSGNAEAIAIVVDMEQIIKDAPL